MPNDIVIFAREFSFDEKNKRRSPWTKDEKKLIGKLKEVIIVRVTKGYYKSIAKNGPWSNDRYHIDLILIKI